MGCGTPGLGSRCTGPPPSIPWVMLLGASPSWALGLLCCSRAAATLLSPSPALLSSSITRCPLARPGVLCPAQAGLVPCRGEWAAVWLHPGGAQEQGLQGTSRDGAVLPQPAEGPAGQPVAMRSGGIPSVPWAVSPGCTEPPVFPADAAPLSPLCHLFSSHSLSLFAFPFPTPVPTSVGTLGEAGKHCPVARFVLPRRRRLGT